MSYGPVRCSACKEPLNQGGNRIFENGWRHSLDNSPRCRGAVAEPDDDSEAMFLTSAFHTPGYEHSSLGLGTLTIHDVISMGAALQPTGVMGDFQTLRAMQNLGDGCDIHQELRQGLIPVKMIPLEREATTQKIAMHAIFGPKVKQV